MKKVILNALVSGCFIVMSGAAIAAPDSGNIRFLGDITNSACAIGGGQQGADMTVALGSYPVKMFADGIGTKSPMTDFSISLIDCDLSTAQTATIEFVAGSGSSSGNNLLNVENVPGGATGVAVGLVDWNGDVVQVGGSASAPIALAAGTNILNFKAFYESIDSVVEAGPANARAVFKVAYP
uniref:fimbrial protein n=1 Tax=Castellaniella defragrans TaxID=75697 RepID=UPI00333E753B